MNTYTPEEIGQSVFHIEEAKVEGSEVVLSALVDRYNNEAEACLIRFPIPPEYQGHEAEVPQFSGMHMVGFEHGLLADARTVWGYVCPCNF